MIMVEKQLSVITTGRQMILEVHFRPQSNVLPKLMPSVKACHKRFLDLLQECILDSKVCILS